MDKFFPLEISFGELAELYDENPMKIFELIKSLVENVLGSKVEYAKLYKTFLDLKQGIALIEYIVNFEKGSISIKVVHAENPIKAIMEYYKAER